MNTYKHIIDFLPDVEWNIVTALSFAGFPTYLVGGAVRDALYGKEPQDFDIATKARPEEIKEVFKGSDYKVQINVGASSKVALVNGVDVATFRGDKYSGNGHKDVEFYYVDTIEEDLGRRDLTINAMALDLKGNLIDPFNGYADIHHEDGVLVRFVGNPFHRIWEDPNRIIRAFRFVSGYNGFMNEESFVATTESRDLFSKIAPERIHDEIIKTLKTVKEASTFWNLMRVSGLLDVWFPEMVAGFEHDHGNHHSEDIWIHNMIAGDAVTTREPLVKLAAYLHDVGKPASFDAELGTFHDHQHLGADIVRERLKNMKFSNDEIKFIVNSVLVHMDGTANMSPKSRRKLKNKLERYELTWRDYLRLRIGDRTANLSRPNFKRFDIQKYIEQFRTVEEVPFSTHNLALSGGDIIFIFRLNPGKEIGVIQKRAFDHVIDEGEDTNTIEYLTNFIAKDFDIWYDALRLDIILEKYNESTLVCN